MRTAVVKVAQVPIPDPVEREAQLAKAREASQLSFAKRAVDDPVVLARAARIVRAALARGKLTQDDLTPPEQAAS